MSQLFIYILESLTNSIEVRHFLVFISSNSKTNLFPVLVYNFSYDSLTTVKNVTCILSLSVFYNYRMLHQSEEVEILEEDELLF